ncbi:MAG: hypothetical protein EBT04_07475 [Betaproteobacteria bacterium]|nr:hypothetical protein [Betaproteobacteria bacterium]
MSGQLPEPHRNSGPSNNAVHARAIAQDEAASATVGSLEKEPAPAKSKAAQRLVLNLKAIEEAKRGLDQGAVTPHYGPWRNDIIELLNDSLATELICSLRYRRHHFTAEGLSSPKIAEEFLVHANEEMAHADMIAKRIVELGGMPDFAPDSLTRRSHAGYDESKDLTSMITAYSGSTLLRGKFSAAGPAGSCARRRSGARSFRFPGRLRSARLAA